MKTEDSLFEACEKGDLKSLNCVLKSNPELYDAEGPSGRTPLWTAVWHGHPDVVAELINKGANTFKRSIISCRLGNIHLRPYLLAHFAIQQIQKKNNHAIVEKVPAKLEYYENIKNLLIKVNDEKDLSYAALSGDLSFLKKNVNAKNINLKNSVSEDEGMSLLDLTILGEHLDCCKYLIDQGAKHTEREQGQVTGFPSTWYTATMTKNIEIYDLLLTHNQKLCKELSKQSDLCWAVMNEEEDLEKILRKHGCKEMVWGRNIDIRNQSCLNEFKKAKAHGLDLTQTDYKGRTYLHQAAKANKPKAVKLLIEIGLNLDAVDNEGNPALIHAMKSKKKECVAILLEAGCDANISGAKSFSALDLALKGKKEQLITILKKHGALPKKLKVK